MTTIDNTLDVFERGMSVYVAGGTGEPTALLEAWSADPDRSRNLSITTTSIPGVNHFDFGQLHKTAVVTGLFMNPVLSVMQRQSKYRHLPLSYYGFTRQISSLPPFDVAVVQVSPPDEKGLCSLGPSVEFTPLILARTRKAVAVVNTGMLPFIGAPALPIAAFDSVAYDDTPMLNYDPGKAGPEVIEISNRLAQLIPDDAVLQTGIGRVPSALFDALNGHRNLKFQSGMFTDGIDRLIDVGAVDPHASHVACMAIGSANFYEWASARPELTLRSCDKTHNPASFIGVDNFFAINSAVEVDIFGQCALEYAGGAAISGAGGAPDFTKAAQMANRGTSIIALNATAKQGSRSRIVPRLSKPSVATLARTDVDIIVTENGIADLRLKSVWERAELIIELAAPAFRGELIDAWHEIAREL